MGPLRLCRSCKAPFTDGLPVKVLCPGCEESMVRLHSDRRAFFDRRTEQERRDVPDDRRRIDRRVNAVVVPFERRQTDRRAGIDRRVGLDQRIAYDRRYASG